MKFSQRSHLLTCTSTYSSKIITVYQSHPGLFQRRPLHHSCDLLRVKLDLFRYLHSSDEPLLDCLLLELDAGDDWWWLIVTIRHSFVYAQEIEATIFEREIFTLQHTKPSVNKAPCLGQYQTLVKIFSNYNGIQYTKLNKISSLTILHYLKTIIYSLTDE